MLAATTGAVITTRTARQRPDQKKALGRCFPGAFLDFRGLPATLLEIRDGAAVGESRARGFWPA